ncbi:MAG TPA: hypothetical protein VLK83_05560 [Rhodanobacteraceae bacterium]|nr:hypothetical protein [Rhodanobacteraceae bacterium]
MLIHGSCHCRNIAFALDWQPEPYEIPARACTCSFCTRRGGVWTACPTGSLRVTIADPALVSAYRFGTETADFHICTRCGDAPVVTSLIDGQLFAVVSVNAFDDVEPSLLKRVSSNVEGEIEDARLARRKRNWIGDVAFVAGVGG